ncbi:hypothetical protein [Sphingomonas sp.]|uniref:hypothetical protein n=1 Tax=Sphingomonas sp. TaxID=28214 RepID=UPI003B000767
MAASNKNELPLENPSEDESGTDAEATVSVEAGDEPQADNAASVEPVADDVATGEEDTDTPEDADTDDDHDVSEDPDAGGNFQPIPMCADEFVVPLSWLGEWQHRPRRGSRFFGAHEADDRRRLCAAEALRCRVRLQLQPLLPRRI